MDHISRVGIFLEVVKYQSFAAAARSLGMTGPAISKQVQSLEDRLGVRLLHRTTRQVTLTEEGALYSDRARKALEDLTEAEQQIQELKESPTGVLKINVPMAFGRRYLTQPIAAFARQYPDVIMDVDFDDRRVDVIAEGYDVVVRIGALEDSSLIARKLIDCPIKLFASHEFVQMHGLPQRPEDVPKFPSIIYTASDAAHDWRYQDPDGSTATVSFTRKFAANSSDMMLEACQQGIGLALMPIFAVTTHLQSGQLIEVLPEYQTSPERGIYVMFPQNRHLSTKTRLFVDWMTQCSKAFPW